MTELNGLYILTGSAILIGITNGILRRHYENKNRIYKEHLDRLCDKWKEVKNKSLTEPPIKVEPASYFSPYVTHLELLKPEVFKEFEEAGTKEYTAGVKLFTGQYVKFLKLGIDNETVLIFKVISSVDEEKFIYKIKLVATVK